MSHIITKITETTVLFITTSSEIHLRSFVLLFSLTKKVINRFPKEKTRKSKNKVTRRIVLES